MEVTVHEAGAPAPAALSPSEQIVAAAKKTASCVGPSGKSYTLRKITPLVRMDIFEAIGSELSQNFPFMTYALTAASVASVDGSPEPVPTTKTQVRALVARLGDDFDTVAEAVAKAFSDEDATNLDKVKN